MYFEKCEHSNLRIMACLCRPILHRYANEDVSLGSWFIGLEVEHVDDRSMCCGTPPGMIEMIPDCLIDGT